MNETLAKRADELWRLFNEAAGRMGRIGLRGHEGQFRKILSGVCGADYDLLKTLVDRKGNTDARS